ncbi:AIPR family protein [Streptomyces sp. NPDC002328]|uniref:AIPR family protein n=1 Tax=Streptomyces sp. NPDC002328 TaxID=3364642 RepID=UPI00369EAF53
MPYPVQVRNLRRKLTERFRPLVDMEDVAERPDEEQMFLSRAVAALAVKIETACSDEEAGRSVIDSSTDKGIDAVAVQPRGDRQHVTLVQAKWSDKGEAGFGEHEAAALIRGLDYLLELEFHRFGSKIDRHSAAIDAALNSPSPKVTLVLALVTGTDLHQNTKDFLNEVVDKHNLDDDLVELKVVNLRDLHREILGEHAERKVDLDVQVDGVGKIDSPYTAYYGTVSAEAVAGWYDDHGRHLTARNIRDALDVSDVNDKIRATLVKEPEHFWYLSNGITLLCDRIRKHGKGAPVAGAGAGFRLEGASLINGAQTVSAVHRAMRQKPGKAALGRLLVRIISLEDCPEDFGDRVTVAANTQNPTQERDFRSRRPEQSDLRHDFALSLSLQYVIKRGQPEPARDEGCTMDEAAIALAAAHSPGLAAQAKRDASALWGASTYRQLFGAQPTAHRVWRCVQLLRGVREALEREKESAVGRLAGAAAYGDLLITHVLYRAMGVADLDEEKEADAAWEARLAEVPDRVRRALAWMVIVIDGAYGRNSQLGTAVRTEDRAQLVTDGLYARVLGNEEPPSDAESRLDQEPGSGGRVTNAVWVIVDAERLQDGTVLEFRPVTGPERRQLPRWIEEDPRRAQATWQNNKVKPLVWAVDGKAYAPSTLVRLMRRTAMGNDQQVQGTRHWHVPELGALVDIAKELRENGGTGD